MESTWTFHFRSFRNVTPSSLKQVTFSKGRELIDNVEDSSCGGLRRKEMVKSLHFLGCNFMLLLIDQASIELRSCCIPGGGGVTMDGLGDGDVINIHMVTSSTSLIITTNRMGPSLGEKGTENRKKVRL